MIERGGKPAQESRLGLVAPADVQRGGRPRRRGDLPARKLAALGLAVLMLCAAPLLWAALGPAATRPPPWSRARATMRTAGPAAG